MAQMGRPGLSPAQPKELWQRWKEGESLSEIGRTLARHASRSTESCGRGATLREAPLF